MDSDEPKTASDLNIGLPPAVVRAVLNQNARAGLALAHHNASRTSYTISPAGMKHLATVMEVV